MNKAQAARWFSVIVLGALAVGCGHRSDNGGQKPQPVTPAACVPPPSDATKPSALASAMAPSPTPAIVATPAASSKPAEKPSAKPASASDAPLKVRRLVVAEGVERSKREPIGAKASFKVADVNKLYAFVEVENPEKAESEVLVTFEPEDNGASQGQISLKVGAAPRWRTWAFTRGVKKAGSWVAVVRDTDGKVLARTPFEVTL